MIIYILYLTLFNYFIVCVCSGADDDLSEDANADADTNGQNNDAKWASNSYTAMHYCIGVAFGHSK